MCFVIFRHVFFFCFFKGCNRRVEKLAEYNDITDWSCLTYSNIINLNLLMPASTCDRIWENQMVSEKICFFMSSGDAAVQI